MSRYALYQGMVTGSVHQVFGFGILDRCRKRERWMKVTAREVAWLLLRASPEVVRLCPKCFPSKRPTEEIVMEQWLLQREMNHEARIPTQRTGDARLHQPVGRRARPSYSDHDV